MTVNRATFVAVSLDDLPVMRRFLRRMADQFGFDEDAASDMVVAVNEAVTNSLVHGYGSESGHVRLVIEVVDSDLQVRLYDQAPPFDPTRAPSPAVDLPLEERQPGGLGIHMMRHFCDELHYRRNTKGENELTLIKHTTE
jgi:anti-sigma regulatory factor (Ser/Thr protein kinase)